MRRHLSIIFSEKTLFFQKNLQKRGSLKKKSRFFREEGSKPVDKRAQTWYNTLCMYNRRVCGLDPISGRRMDQKAIPDT
jgi:hypothetical protein